ncbi:MAG TPA: hypothetical protein PKK18_01195 [Chitinophagales bacterium]|nr:hypothetical protein [Chitinophagales bacterium]HMW11674.1 hypothetical protein [Chitinophagales bacterium]HMX59182.1 hypothetical protein [Chitinophagales bacterium]HMY23428.1 hypothetical protein [Chitinophagales bacterium]HMZ33891.1 hypothetical protein [Chitinophagales bacterium]
MKKLLILIVISLVMLHSQARPKVYVKVNKNEHRYVKVCPSATNVVVVKPACPSPKHIWIDGDWIWNPQINQYVYVQGKWIIPISTKSIWIAGHWKNSRYGWHWVPGYWK